MTSFGYIIVDSCIISLNLNCVLELKQFYNIATKVSCRKKCYYFWWSTWLIRRGMTRHGKARRDEARWDYARRRLDKYVSPGCEKYCSTLSRKLLNVASLWTVPEHPAFLPMGEILPVFHKYSARETIPAICWHSTYNTMPQKVQQNFTQLINRDYAFHRMVKTLSILHKRIVNFVLWLLDIFQIQEHCKY